MTNHVGRADDDGQGYPLAPAQERLWLSQQLEPDSTALNVPLGIRLVGPLNVPALEQSLSELVRRHEMLRAVMLHRDGNLCQLIRPAERVHLNVVHVHAEGVQAKQEELQRLVQREFRKPFHLSEGPIFRAGLFRVSERDHVLLLTAHHIVTDAWSRNVIWEDLHSLYSAYSKGEQPELDPLPLRYVDFATEQRKRMNDSSLESSLAYWRSCLQDAPPYCQWPVDHPRPSRQSYRGQSRSIFLGGELVSGLNKLAQQNSATVFMVLRAAFALLIGRYTNSNDVVIGTPVAGRARLDVERLVGFFINMIALRTDLSGDPTFLELLRDVREQAIEAYAHQQVPFQRVVHEVVQQRDLTVTPIFQVIFQLKDYPRKERHGCSLEFHEFEIETDSVEYDLAFDLMTTPTGIHCRCNFATELFEPPTIKRMLESFRQLLQEIVDDSDRKISTLSRLTAPQRQQILVDWNSTGAEYPNDKCVHELFEAQVQRTPDAIAVVFEDQQLTYRQLNEHADRLASNLRSRQNALEEPIGLLVDRGPEIVIGLLGIMKAGAAYVPLDPEWPDQRLAVMIEDARIRFVVTHPMLAPRVASLPAEPIHFDAEPIHFGAEPIHFGAGPSGFDAGPISLERDPSEVGAQTRAGGCACTPTAPDNLAYLIYTSGSSGQPKAVAVEHRQLVNYVFAVTERLGFQPTWSYASVSTIAADLGNTMVFPSLCIGGCLHLISKDRAVDPASMADYCRQRPIDCLKTTPSHLAAVVDSPHAAQILPREMLIAGGESFPRELSARLKRLSPNCRVVNHYGPSETTVGVATFQVDGDSPTTVSGTLPIGRPLPNSRIFILDDQMQPVPIGVRGQLCIGGAGVARGYWNRKQLTEDRFVPDPFVDDIQDPRMFLTGDVARFLPDGNIEFLGRRDQQIKIRGHRVELGEVEAAILAHPGVADAAVIAITDHSGQRRLVGFAVCKGPDKSQRVDQALDNKPTYRLPNNLVVAHLNQGETEYLYREIFQLQAYLRHGIKIEEGDCVLDVGANIGLFSVFVSQLCPSARIFAFEPNPVVFELLEANTSVHCRNATLLDFGLSDQPRIADFTFFEGFSLLSGYGADADQAKSVVSTYLTNQQRHGVAETADLQTHVDDLLDHRFQGRPIATRLRTLHEIIAEKEIERIDLLKINVEKSELDVLRGIGCDDWSMIRQIVLEVDVQANLPPITEILNRHGYESVVIQDKLLTQTELCYVYAIRPSDRARLLVDQPADAHLCELPVLADPAPTKRELTDYLSQQLPSYMVPSSMVLLDALPLTANGKLDRRALENHRLDLSDSDDSYTAPRTSTEKILANIWQDVLDAPRVGASDNFVVLGGHSLNAAAVVSKIREAFDVELSFRQFFSSATLAALAGQVDAAVRDNLGRQPQSIQSDCCLDLPRSASHRLFHRPQSAPDHLDTPLSDLPVLSEREQQQVLVEWNETTVDYPGQKCVHELFEEQADRNPDAVAIVFDDQEVTYRQLNERANQLAHHLRGLGVGPDTLVALCIDRSSELVVAILGILKAGGAYLPLTADDPDSRLQFMLDDAGVGFLVTHSFIVDRIPASDCQVVLVDRDLENVPQAWRSNPSAGVVANNLAYVMFTSGSTGRPKGVAIEHASIARLVMGNDYARFGPDRVFLQLATPSFDASTFELWGSLLHGGTLVVAPHALLEFAALEQLLKRHRVTTLWLTATLFNQLIDHNPHILDGVEEVLTGGESLSVRHIRMAQAALGPGVQFINGYGPTEGTTFTTCYRIPANLSPDLKSIPIGRPIANTKVYVLDQRQRPAPVNVPGELYVGGAGLARGYLNRPELTADKFVANPFSGDPESRLYRTGDLCCWREDGNLEFLGRLDDQVKLRGYRIEQGEIESVLNEHDSVSRSVVLLREDRAGDKRLVAYCAPSPGYRLDFADLKGHLSHRLPAYMLPGSFVAVDAMPLTASGKIDRRSLPPPDDARCDQDEYYVAPSNPLEQQLAAIWRDVLGIERKVGVHDNFFDLGGHSLTAMLVVAQIRAVLGVDIPLRRVFKVPTIESLANEIETLRTDVVKSSVATIAPVDRQSATSFPLSFAQERFWFVEQLEIDCSLIHNSCYAHRLVGPLDLTSLRKALHELVSRHEILRTTYPSVDGKPAQVVAPTGQCPLEVIDMSGLQRPERESAVVGVIKRTVEQGVDLATGPTFRGTVIRFSELEHALVLCTHHIATDHWSQLVLYRDLAQLYSTFKRGAPSALGPLPVQYVDYAVWEREQFKGESIDQKLAYWRDRLSDLEGAELMTDYPRPALQLFRGAAVRTVLPPSLIDQVTSLAQHYGVTRFIAFLAALTVLLRRLTEQDDVVVGAPVAGRERVETQDLIGCFLNTIVLRTQLSGNPTFGQALARVRDTAIGAYDNQEVPFQKLLQELCPDRDLAKPAWLQVFINDFNLQEPYMELDGLRVSPIVNPEVGADFDLNFFLRHRDDQTHLTLAYREDLFCEERMTDLLDQYIRLLEQIVRDPDAPIDSYSLLSKSQRHQLLVEWNDTARDFSGEQCVHRLVEQQVERNPGSIAVVFEDQQLTYRELNDRSNQLAHHLQSLGVGPETLVGLCLERSPQLVIGMLGILKAGGAYLPLDADCPVDRLQFMLADANIGFVVTQSALQGRFADADCMAICEDAFQSVSQLPATGNPASRVGPDNLAYVIYTSGSTGVPKGVMIPHAALANHMKWFLDAFPVTAKDNVLQKTPASADASVWEFFAPLMCGARLTLAAPGSHRDASELLRTIGEHKITVLQVAPTLLRTLLDQTEIAEWDSVRHVFSGGEELTVADQRKLFEVLPDVRLTNLYGPTETCIDSLFWRCDATGDEPRVPIGRPISNTQIYILDQQQQPVPIGAPGELYIGGDGLARGYLNRPQLTAQQFVPNPFSDDPKSRLYRTGDRCRLRFDGNVEFLGRFDHQVSVRGHRVELGEIESVLNECPDIAHCVVALREDRPGYQRLVAYCVAARDCHWKLSELQRHLKRRLPDYMLPSAFVNLEALPLTRNGKVDRRALPAPDDVRPELATSYVAARNPIEHQLTLIWCDILGMDSIGIHDNFFALGGHSLLATHLAARIATAFDVELPLRRVFESPTIAESAIEVERAKRETKSSDAEWRPVDRIHHYQRPLSFEQQRMWFLEQMEGEQTLYNMPTAWRIRGSLDYKALRRALEEVVNRHEPLRTTFVRDGDQTLQMIAESERFVLPIEDLSSLEIDQLQTQMDRRCQAEAERRFDLTADSMLRATLLRLADDDHLLLLTAHHIASDGWSQQVLWRELQVLYDAYRDGIDPDLPDVAMQYSDYVMWQREKIAGEKLERLSDYWCAQLRDTPVLELPTDHPRPANVSYRGDWLEFQIRPELVARLKSLSRSEQVTLHMLLLAAFQTLLSRYSGQHDIAVGTPVAGRNRVELERLIGLFVNTLVLRTDLSGDPSFRELLARVRKVSLDAYEHRDLPFEKLVEQLQPDRHLSRSPLFQVMFQLMTFTGGGLKLANLQVDQKQSRNPRARFDLEMHLWLQPDHINGALVYNTDLFERQTIERMVGHFIQLLEGIVTDADQRISELPLLTDTERDQLLVQWNDTATQFPRHQCLHELFEQQVDRTPDATAVIFEDQQLTYRQLNERANQLAHHLRRSGAVGPETVVGLCLQRSKELVVSILGILKAGGAYLPLDPDHPVQRLQFMMQDAAVAHLVTQSSLIDRLPAQRCPLTCLDDVGLDDVGLDWGSLPRTNPAVDVGGDRLAYVMYTSGSTGQPKGVAVMHRSVVNLLRAIAPVVPIDRSRRFLGMASATFDISVAEMFLPLTAGGTTILVSKATAMDGRQLASTIDQQQADVIQATPAAWSSLLQTGWRGGDGVTLISTGEALPRSLASELLKAGGSVWDFYGPTETTIWSTIRQVTAENLSGVIGRPIANTQVYVLDPHQHPTPIGVPGELYIGGSGLARGYLQRPELNAARFVSNPFSADPNSRLYRTGDVCRWRADGSLEFLGRQDDQVKLRGFRIELGEIAAVLQEHPSIGQSVVVLHGDRDGDSQLVAYCIAAGETDVDSSQLRAHLLSRLPDYMLPSAFVLLDRFPMTSSGKIDRKTLAAIKPKPDSLAEFAPPATPLEEALADIWCELLRLEHAGRYDDFFALGGHSLLAFQVVSRIRDQFDIELPVRSMFEAPTIAQFSQIVLDRLTPSNPVE